MQLNEFLRDIRKQNGKSITQVAKEIGITKQYISAIELSKRKPTLKLMKLFANYYNVKLEYLIELYDKSI